MRWTTTASLRDPAQTCGANGQPGPGPRSRPPCLALTANSAEKALSQQRIEFIKYDLNVKSRVEV